MIFLACPSCSKVFATLEKKAEKEARCPFCRTSVRVPRKSQSLEAVATLVGFDCPHCGKPTQAETLSLSDRTVPCQECGKPIALTEDAFFDKLLTAVAILLIGSMLLGILRILTSL